MHVWSCASSTCSARSVVQNPGLQAAHRGSWFYFSRCWYDSYCDYYLPHALPRLADMARQTNPCRRLRPDTPEQPSTFTTRDSNKWSQCSRQHIMTGPHATVLTAPIRFLQTCSTCQMMQTSAYDSQGNREAAGKGLHMVAPDWPSGLKARARLHGRPGWDP